jgi:outer membrane protein insertion porin family
VRVLSIVGLFLTILLVNSVCTGFAQEGVIKEIVVFGNERVDEEVILKEIGSKAGETFSQERVREDIKAIYRLGYFRDVQVDVSETAGEIILTFAVIEKPFVVNIIISGNVKLDQEEIEEVIEVKRDTVLDMGKVQSSVTQIKKLYTSKRYFGSEVNHWVEVEKGNKAVVYFDIVEGVKGYLTKIIFIGNKVLGARKLKSVMQTKEKGWVWWLTKSGRLETDVLEVDITRIRSLYHNYGYVTVKMSEPEITLSENKKSIQITIRIEEGEQYSLGSLDITGDILTSKEDLLRGIKSKGEKVYNASQVQKDLLWLSDKYADQGYAYVDVSPMTMLDHENKLVHLNFKIEKGIEVAINRIEIVGNTTTRDKVIRRELKIAEGDRYSSTRIRKSRQRVVKTQYFKEVDFAPSPTEKKELIDLDIRVEEQQMGRLEFGGGYSSEYGVIGGVGLSHGNLFGRGYKAYLKGELGEEVLTYEVGFTDPRFLDTPLSVGLSAYNRSYEYNTYDADVIGGTINFGMEITDTIRTDLDYLLERVRIYDIDESYVPSDYIYQEWLRGWTTTSKVTVTVTRDTINNVYNPTKGSKIWVAGTIAGLGGDNYFYAAAGGANWYHSIIGDLVLNLRGNVGIIRGYNNSEVPLPSKYFVGGGAQTLRGFDYGMAGPLDRNLEPIGALNMVAFTTELTYPLSKTIGLKAAVFYDIGKGFDHWDDITPLRNAVGVGLRWYSPFGPIRIDWGYNLMPISHRGEKTNVWDFSMGAMF